MSSQREKCVISSSISSNSAALHRRRPKTSRQSSAGPPRLNPLVRSAEIVMLSSPRTPTNSANNVGHANSFTVVETAHKDSLALNEAIEIDADQLAQYLSSKESAAGAKNLFIVDCRSFIQYNSCHVRGAVNAFYSKIMRRRLINDTACSDSILNHISLAGGTEDVDLVLYGSDNEEADSPKGPKDVAPLRLTPAPRAAGRKIAGRTLYERRKQVEAEAAAAATGDKENDSIENPNSPISLLKPPNLKLNGLSSNSPTRSARPTLSLKLPNADAENAKEQTDSNEPSFVRFLFEKLRNSTRLKFHRILLLKDSFNDFRVQYPNLCESSRHQQKRMQRELNEAEKLGGELKSGGPRLPLATAPPALDVAPNFETDSEEEDDQPPVHPSTSVPPEVDGPTKVLDFLYLGTMDDAEDEKFLRENGITCVINICERAFRPSCVKNDASHFKQISVKDSTDTKLRPLFDEVVEFIENARLNGDKVLIHCQAGISRSATLAIAYIIGSRRVAFRDAYDFVKNRRAAIEPNFAFIYQLMRYSDDLRMKREEENAEETSSMNGIDPISTSRLEVTSPDDRQSTPQAEPRSIDVSPNRNNISGETRKRAMDQNEDKRKISRRYHATDCNKTDRYCQSDCVRDVKESTSKVKATSPTTEFSKLDISLFPPSEEIERS